MIAVGIVKTMNGTRQPNAAASGPAMSGPIRAPKARADRWNENALLRASNG